MIENRPTAYAPYIKPWLPEKVRQPVYVHMDGMIHKLAVSHGPSECGYDVRLAEGVELRAGHAVLAATHEWVGMPLHLSADVVGKSTWARLGVSLNTTKVDPGFSGAITLEITYNPLWAGWWPYYRGLLIPRSLFIPAGAGIGTVVFHTLASHADYSRTGKFGGCAGPEEAR